jgi:iron complex outermembrane receptor protein
VQFVSITSFHRAQIYGPIDLDLAPADWKWVGTRPESQTTTQEFQLLSPANRTSRLKWIAGLFYYHDYAPDVFDLEGYGYSPLAPVGIDAYQTTQSYAGFGQATYSIVEGTDLTLGARITRDDRATAGTQSLELPSGPVILAQTTQPGSKVSSVRTASFSRPTYKASLAQHLGANILAYGSFSTGFKSGVFNTMVLNTPAVRPETVNAWEVGLKSEWLDHKLRVNIAGYDETYKNIQFSAFSSGFYTLANAAAARIDGVDFDITAVPIEKLELTLSGTLMNPRYTSFANGPGYVSVPIGTVNPNGGMGGFLLTPTDLTGKQMIQASKETVNMGADYDFALAGGELSLTAVVQYRSKFFFDPQDGAEQRAFTQVNSSVQWYGPGHHWYMRLWVDNLTNKLIYANVTRSTTSDWATPAPPRTYGVAFGFKM